MPCIARQPFAKTDSLFNKIGEIMDIVIVPKLKKDTTKHK